MKNKILLFNFLFVIVTISFSQNLSFDKSKSSINFTIKNAGFTVEGNFSEFEMEGNFDRNDLQKSSFLGTAVVKSIDTGINARNNSLQKEEYFDADRYPEILLLVQGLKKNSDIQYQTSVTLSIKGKRKHFSLPIIIEESLNEVTVKGKFELNRRDFEIGGKSWFMDDKVKISIIYVGKK